MEYKKCEDYGLYTIFEVPKLAPSPSLEIIDSNLSYNLIIVVLIIMGYFSVKKFSLSCKREIRNERY